MDFAEIKLDLYKKIDTLEPNKFYDLYGMIMNYINGNNEDEWNLLSENQKSGIYEAIKEIDSGNRISHKAVISKYRNKYGDGE